MEMSFLYLTIRAHMKEAPAEIDVFLYVRRFHGMKLEARVVEEEVNWKEVNVKFSHAFHILTKSYFPIVGLYESSLKILIQ